MASDDFDIVIEAMLEAPYKNREDEGQSKEEKRYGESSRRKRSRSRERRNSRDKYRPRSSHSRERHRGHEQRYRSRSRDRRHSPRDRRRDERDRFRNPGHHHTFNKSRSPRKREKSPVREPIDNLSPEERDARTVFCMQLAARIRPRDLEDFFSAVGKVRDVRIISDRNSRRSKGIAYVEFCDIQSVPLAIGLTGQRLLGVPIIVQVSQAEKNRLAAMANNLQRGHSGPMRLYVGSLHYNITEEMLRGIFEPFGKIENIQLMKEPDSGRSKGFGFITFSDADSARIAQDQLNGFELAGRPLKVGNVTERSDGGGDILTALDSDDMERSGIDLGATGRLQLMAKLAEGTGMQLPLAVQAALQLNGAIPLAALTPSLSVLNPALSLPGQTITTQSFPFFNTQTM